MLNVPTQLGSWTSFHLTSSNVETWSWPRCSSMLDKVSFETGDIQFSCVFCNVFYSFSALLGRSDEHLMAFRLSHRQFFTWKLHTHFRWIWMLTYDIGYIGIWSVSGLWKEVESKDSHLCTKCTSEPAWVSSSPGRVPLLHTDSEAVRPVCPTWRMKFHVANVTDLSSCVSHFHDSPWQIMTIETLQLLKGSELSNIHQHIARHLKKS